MATSGQARLATIHLLLLAVAFIAAVILSNRLFQGVRVDLTANNLYTLSDGTKRILNGLEEPLKLYYFFSDDATKGLPSVRDYALRVRELLQEFEAASDGMLQVETIDPLPFSEDEDRAAGFGLQGIALTVTPDPVYFGLAGTNSIGDEEVIAFFQPEREATLEYDIARLVSTLASPERTVVGVISGVSMGGRFDPQTQQVVPAWAVFEQAREFFDVRDLGTSVERIPDDVSLLWVVQPTDLPAATLYAIDQFVMAGGNALIFVDPVASIDAPAEPGMPPGMPAPGRSSDLPRLFEAWGIDYDPGQVVVDAQLALALSGGIGARPVRHYGYLGLGPEQINANDVVTMDLGSINAALAGHIKPADAASIEFEPLLRSTSLSATAPASQFAFLPDPAVLQDDYSPGGESLTIAARISGSLTSAFPDGRPDEPDTDSEQGTADDTTANSAPHLDASAGPVNLVVVADVDLLSDPLWVQRQSFFGQRVASAFASNGAFVVNALENLAGSADLIAVRSRGSFSRPFTRVDELRAEAETRFRATEQRLQQELAETERRLGELQSARDDAGSLLLTSEQQTEIDRFIEQRAAIRSELRAVQRGLDHDIETLGMVLKAINIGLVPLLVTILTLAALWRRRRRTHA